MFPKKKSRFISGVFSLLFFLMIMPMSALGLPPVDFDPVTPIDPVLVTTTVNWSTDEFEESSASDGSIANVITLTLDGSGTFDGSDGAVFPASDYSVDNVPDGLSVQIVQVDSQTAQISLPGKATLNAAINSIDNLTIDVSGIISALVLNNNNKDNLKITYTGLPVIQGFPVLPPLQFAPSMTWSDTEFAEANANDGSISTNIMVTLANADFTGSNGDIYEDNNQYTEANLPDGLALVVRKINSTTVELKILGNASNHEENDSIDDLDISFTDAAVNNATEYDYVTNSSIELEINFEDAEETTPAYGTLHATISIGSLIYTVNGAPYSMDAVPYIANDRTYVPVRYLAYALGLSADDISWNGSTQTVTIVDAETVITLTIGSNYIFVNGTPTLMDVAPEITSDRTMLPARWVAEALGASVGWDPSTRTVIMDKIL